MPANRNALIRYKTIDKCLQNRYRKWTLEDLIEVCSEALYEYEGIKKPVSKRTIQSDIFVMRSDKLGYNAPIIVVDKKHYKYEDNDYSITNIPISENDLKMMMESVNFLKQFKGFSHFRELDSMVKKLEDYVYSQKMNKSPAIDFEKNENLKGLNFLDGLYKAITNENALQITYQSYKARNSDTFDFYPYLLKEYRNRWFVLGKKNKSQMIYNLALDRIIEIKTSELIFYKDPNFNESNYFRQVIGVTVNNQPPETVELFIPHKHAPYILTKPLHSSQKVVEKNNFGVTISLKVQHNFELEKEILSFGEQIKVIGPTKLKRRVIDRLSDALDSYNSEINEKNALNIIGKVEHYGYAVVNNLYTKRELKELGTSIHKFSRNPEEPNPDLKNLFFNIKELKEKVFNQTLSNLFKLNNDQITFKNSDFLSIQFLNNEWHQNQIESNEFNDANTNSINKIKSVNLYILFNKNIEDYELMEIYPGTQNKVLCQTEIQAIIKNNLPTKIKIKSGSILLLSPLILKRAIISNSKENLKIIEISELKYY